MTPPAREPGSERAGTTSEAGASGLATPDRGEPELVVARDADQAARLVAERIAAALVTAIDERGRADFCTTGGSAPVPIYRYLRAEPLRDRIAWDRVHVWWGDDRFVPRGSPESNVTSLDRVLLRYEALSGQSGQGDAGTDVESGEEPGVPLPPANVHPFPTDVAIAERRDTGWCARRYAEEIGAAVPRDAANWPVFDLVLVGIGEDGHVLSCFPDSPAFDTLEWAVGVPAPTHIGPHLPRVTLNPRILDAAPVLVAGWGETKAEALGHVFGEIRDDRRWPVQRTRRPGAVWIVDESAAEQVPPGVRG